MRAAIGGLRRRPIGLVILLAASFGLLGAALLFSGLAMFGLYISPTRAFVGNTLLLMGGVLWLVTPVLLAVAVILGLFRLWRSWGVR